MDVRGTILISTPDYINTENGQKVPYEEYMIEVEKNKVEVSENVTSEEEN